MTTLYCTDKLDNRTDENRMNPAHCALHGYPECSICYHAPGHCEYGACEFEATVRATYASARTGKVTEVRSLCTRHGNDSVIIAGANCVKIADNAIANAIGWCRDE